MSEEQNNSLGAGLGAQAHDDDTIDWKNILKRPFSTPYMDKLAFKNGNYPYAFDSFSRSKDDRQKWINEAIRLKNKLDYLASNPIQKDRHLILHVGGYLLSSIKAGDGKLPKQCRRKYSSITTIIDGRMMPPIHLIGEMKLSIIIIVPEREESLSDNNILKYITNFYKDYHGNDVDIDIIGLYRCCFPTLKQVSDVNNIVNKIKGTTLENHIPTITDVSYNHFSGLEKNGYLESTYDKELHGKLYTRNIGDMCQNYAYGTSPSVADVTFTNMIRDKILEIAESETKLTIFNDAVLDIHKLMLVNDEYHNKFFFAVMPDIFQSITNSKSIRNTTLIETGYSGYNFWRYRYWSNEEGKVNWYNDVVNDNESLYC